MFILLLLAVLSNPVQPTDTTSTTKKTEIVPVSVVVNTATVEYKNEKGETFKANSNTVKTTVIETVALNILR
jgi:hypothetical protein